jgi:hypothetical protein
MKVSCVHNYRSVLPQNRRFKVCLLCGEWIISQINPPIDRMLEYTTSYSNLTYTQIISLALYFIHINKNSPRRSKKYHVRSTY